jgi:hypothetical protein
MRQVVPFAVDEQLAAQKITAAQTMEAMIARITLGCLPPPCRGKSTCPPLASQLLY